jgi:hypothetical protein
MNTGIAKFLEENDKQMSHIDAERRARAFHEAYERLAPQFGYETRADTKQFDPKSPNGLLMIAVMLDLEDEF